MRGGAWICSDCYAVMQAPLGVAEHDGLETAKWLLIEAAREQQAMEGEECEA